jgi:predicted outer membrane repeat protein
MKTILIKDKIFLLLVFFFLFFITCNYHFDSVNQPNAADPNSTFEVQITVRLEAEDRGGIPYFGIRLPVGWTIMDNISYTGVLSGTLVYSAEMSDSMEIVDNPPEGYYWWVSIGDKVDFLPDGTVSIKPQIQTDDQTDLFFIDYMLGDSGNGLNFRRDDHHPISIGLPMSVTVTNTNNSGEGSLRQAIKDVSIDGEILFDLTYPATIVVESQLEIDRNITITGPEIGDLTISGKKNDRIFLINEDLNVNISNLYIVNGYASGESPDGGGIYCNSSNLCLNNVTIRDNSADNSGGGIYFGNSDVTLTNVIIAKNQATNGGGIGFGHQRSKPPIVTNVTITENTALLDGGGIFCTGEIGLRNCIVWNNSPQSFYLKSGYIKALYSNIQGGLIGEGNIDADPLFADTIHYYLNENSPCIDYGDPDSLFNDQEDSEKPDFALWPAHGALRNDMGAYGGHGKYENIHADKLNENIRSADFINGEIGWLCGEEKIFKTEDGGQSWMIIPTEWFDPMLDFINESVGWATAIDNNDNSVKVFKTVDGGQNWFIQKKFPNVWSTSLYAVNDRDVYLAAIDSNQWDPDFGIIMGTSDGGKTWIDVTPINNSCLFFSVSFLDSNVGIVSGECILRTFDGGVTWDEKSLSEPSIIHSLQFINESTGYFSSHDASRRSQDALFKTTDKYNSWDRILEGVLSYSAVGNNTIFAIIENGILMKSSDGGNTWTGIHLGMTQLFNIKFVDNSTGWIWGNGTILKTTDGGNSWDDLTSAIIVTGINEDDNVNMQIPIQFKLSQNYPNPFNPSTTIEFTLPKSEFVELKVYNIGNHTYIFEGKNLASGVYYYQLVAGEYREVKKMILIK